MVSQWSLNLWGLIRSLSNPSPKPNADTTTPAPSPDTPNQASKPEPPSPPNTTQVSDTPTSQTQTPYEDPEIAPSRPNIPLTPTTPTGGTPPSDTTHPPTTKGGPSPPQLPCRSPNRKLSTKAGQLQLGYNGNCCIDRPRPPSIYYGHPDAHSGRAPSIRYRLGASSLRSFVVSHEILTIRCRQTAHRPIQAGRSASSGDANGGDEISGPV